MIVLAIDCAANLCAACVYDAKTGEERARAVIDLGKGHAEHLMTVIDAALKQGGIAYGDLGMIAVSVGPGSFTGVRVGVSAARGLALALKIPAVGITTLDALAADAAALFPRRPVLVVLDGGRGEIHMASYDESGVLHYGPAVTTLEEISGTIAGSPPVLAGTAAKSVAVAVGGAFDCASLAASADIATYARLAVAKDPTVRPKPLYMRGADAKPQAGFVVPRSGS